MTKMLRYGNILLFTGLTSMMFQIDVFGEDVPTTISDLQLNAGVEAVLVESEEIVTTEADENLNRWNIELDENEYNLLASIVMREAGGQGDKGQQAVVEVIFNRMYSVEFPNTLEEVVSQKTNGYYQFSSYPSRTKYEPTDQVYENIDYVLSGDTYILPYQTLYFSRGKSGLQVETVIEDHVFCNQPNYQEVQTE